METPPLPAELEPEPGFLVEYFGSRLEGLRRYAELLAGYGEQLGLLGPQEYPRLWTRHIVNSSLLAPFLSGHVVDVGSGAGLPGIPLAIVRPDIEFTLVEPMERRSSWLSRIRDELELDHVRVVRERAEELRGRVSADQVTARAVAALSKLVPLTAPLLRPGGELLLLKGRSAEKEIEAAAKAIVKHRIRDLRVEVLGEELPTEPTRVVRGRRQVPTPASRWPQADE